MHTHVVQTSVEIMSTMILVSMVSAALKAGALGTCIGFNAP